MEGMIGVKEVFGWFEMLATHFELVQVYCNHKFLWVCVRKSVLESVLVTLLVKWLGVHVSVFIY